MSTSLLQQGITSAPTTGATCKHPHRNEVNGPAMAWSYQATVAGTGAVTATVVIEVSNDGTNWLTLGTISLSGTTTASDGFASSARWHWVRSKVTAISGTGATVNTLIGW